MAAATRRRSVREPRPAAPPPSDARGARPRQSGTRPACAASSSTRAWRRTTSPRSASGARFRSTSRPRCSRACRLRRRAARAAPLRLVCAPRHSVHWRLRRLVCAWRSGKPRTVCAALGRPRCSMRVLRLRAACMDLEGMHQGSSGKLAGVMWGACSRALQFQAELRAGVCFFQDQGQTTWCCKRARFLERAAARSVDRQLIYHHAVPTHAARRARTSA